jgi:hypothetical protein
MTALLAALAWATSVPKITVAVWPLKAGVTDRFDLPTPMFNP